MHAKLSWNGFRLIGSDGFPGQSCESYKGITLSISVGDPTEAEHLFAALADGGKVTMALAETFWAKRFGMLTDQFGVGCMVNCDIGNGNPHSGIGSRTAGHARPSLPYGDDRRSRCRNG